MFYKQIQSKLGHTNEDRKQNANKLISSLNDDFDKSGKIGKKLNNAVLTMHSEFANTEEELQRLKKHVEYATSFKEPLSTKEKVGLRDQQFLAQHSSKPLDETFDTLFAPEYRKEFGIRGTTKVKEFKRLYSPGPPTTQQKMKHIVKNANIYNKYIQNINQMQYSAYSKYEIDFDALDELEHQSKATNDLYYQYFVQDKDKQKSESESDKLDILDLDYGSQTQLQQSQYQEELEHKKMLFRNPKLRETANTAKILQSTDKGSQFYMNWKNELLSRKYDITERLKYIPGAPISCHDSKL